MNLEKIFRRETSNKQFIPEVDGLRFVAITWVVFHHIFGFMEVKMGFNTSEFPLLIQKILFHNGRQGVQLFFVLSGFILAVPFAKYYLNGSDKPSIKNYFIRRLTRLEPPYIIIMSVLFLGLLLSSSIDYKQLFNTYLSHLLYIHNFVFGKFGGIQAVTWSLEIEVQFYLLAPILCLVFKLKPMYRRSLLVLIMVSIPIIHKLYLPHFHSLYNELHFFLGGILLADFYLTKINFQNPVLARVAALLCLILIFVISFNDFILNSLLYPFIIIILYYNVLNNKFLNQIFKNQFVTSVGGMCYTIYLLHYPIISFLGNPLRNLSPVLFIVIISILILGISSIYYLIIEKPCMDRHWPQKLMNRISKSIPGLVPNQNKI